MSIDPQKLELLHEFTRLVDRIGDEFDWQMAEECARWATWDRTSPSWERTDELRLMPYNEYLRTPEWQRQRQVALARAEYRCQGCNDTRYLEVHHRTYEQRGDEQPGDLTVLCAACHTAVHLVMDARRNKVRPSSRRVPV